MQLFNEVHVGCLKLETKAVSYIMKVEIYLSAIKCP